MPSAAHDEWDTYAAVTGGGTNRQLECHVLLTGIDPINIRPQIHLSSFSYAFLGLSVSLGYGNGVRDSLYEPERLEVTPTTLLLIYSFQLRSTFSQKRDCIS